MDHLIFIPVLLPLLVGVLMLFPPFHEKVLHQRILGVVALVVLIAVNIKLLLDFSEETTKYLLGNWPEPFGIVLVGDPLAAIMLLLTSVLGLAAYLYATAGSDERGAFFHPLFMFQLLGINGAFLTADIFNLFVFFEILLIASYSLLIHGGGKRRTSAAVHYVLLNLVGSAFFLLGLGMIYAAVGSLNMADITMKLPHLTGSAVALAHAGGLLLLLVFGVKAALLPLQFWLPNTYANTSTPVAALFAVLTKVGVYSIWRVHVVMFGPEAGEVANIASYWLWPLSLLTITIGSIGVTASQTLKELTAHLVIVSSGTLLLMLAVNSEESSAAALYYLVHSTIATAGMFLLAGVIQIQRGQARDRFVRARPVAQPKLVGFLFALLAITLVGMPPLSGFVGKILLLQASTDIAWWVWPPVLISSLATLLALSRAGTSLFWRTQGAADGTQKIHTNQLVALVLLIATIPLLVIFGEAVISESQHAISVLWGGRAG